MSSPTSAREGAVTSPLLRRFARARSERFADRHDAGRQLARELERFRAENPIVVALPRGGVPVAAEVAAALGAPLDIVVVRKIGAPMNPEYAIGALAEGGAAVLGDETAGMDRAELDAIVARAHAELDARVERFRRDRPPLPVEGRTVLVVDDGLATGRTARAAILALRRRGAQRIVLAVPVAAPSSAEALADCADEVVCVTMPEDLWAIGRWYDDFSQTTDEEVAEILDRYHPAGGATSARRDVRIAAEHGVELPGDLVLPAGAVGVVAFAHGSGSSRHSPRNREVAAALNDAGVATLLFDLLTSEEERSRANVFDIDLLGRRLLAACRWLAGDAATAPLPLGLFGASTGAAAALTAAAAEPEAVAAVVSRGGRPDLAGDRLADVRAPTLLIVGGHDEQVLELNRQAQAQMTCVSELAVVPGATHLFEEPGTLDEVARLAIDWFIRHLAGVATQH